MKGRRAASSGGSNHRQSEAEIWHDIECGAYGADLPLWRRLARRAARRGRSCRALELGAGTGRVALALAGEGCAVTALDSSPELVATLRRRADGLPLEALQMDAREFELDGEFDLIVAPMQLVQLLRTSGDRVSMLGSVARHLADDGCAALAILDLDESWEATAEEAPAPDMADVGGWVYSSQPVAVRRIQRGRAVELDRVRRVVSPAGELRESFDRIRLELLAPDRIEHEARSAGLVPDARISIDPTADHVGSTVVVLRRHG